LAATETRAGVEARGGGRGALAARRTRAVGQEGGEAGTGLEKTDCCGRSSAFLRHLSGGPGGAVSGAAEEKIRALFRGTLSDARLAGADARRG
jgi:hypothetical protein